MLNPIWLKTFATVAACHSFTEAGRRLDLTQSSVSEHIRRLEQSVGRRLLVRVRWAWVRRFRLLGLRGQVRGRVDRRDGRGSVMFRAA